MNNDDFEINENDIVSKLTDEKPTVNDTVHRVEVDQVDSDDEVDVIHLASDTGFTIPNDVLTEMTQATMDLPNETREEEDNEAEKMTSTEVIKKMNQLIIKGAGDDYNVWTMKRGVSEEVKPSSVEFNLQGKKTIYRNVRQWNPDNTDDRRKLFNSVAMPTDNENNTIAKLIANPGTLEKPESSLEVNVMTDGRELLLGMEGFADQALKDESAGWKQGFSIEGSKRNIASRRTVLSSSGGELSGSYVTSAVSNALGFCGFFTVVLPHSGLVAIISAPLPSELLDLQYVLDTAKINIGRQYGGSNYGEATWFMNLKIVELFIRKISQINLKDRSPENIKRMIDPMDIPSIAWGLATAMYPNGYEYSRTAFDDNGNSAITMGTVWLPDMMICANNRLSLRQKQHLERGVELISSNEEIESYRRSWKNPKDVEECVYTIYKHTTLKPDGSEAEVETQVVLESSNLEKYVFHGSAWDVYLRDALNETLAMEPDENIRANYLSQKIVATQLREYSHFIKEIRIVTTLGEGSMTESIKNDDDIFNTLELLARSNEAREKLLESVLDFINKKQVVIYGVPTKSSWEEEHNSSELSNYIVPINTVATFFTLTDLTYRQLGLKTT